MVGKLFAQADALGGFPGQGLVNRSARADEVAQNTVKNPHLVGRVGTAAGDLAPAPEDNFLYFYHPDHLGSTALVTDSRGQRFEHLEYFPFGETWVEERSNTQRTPYLFTGKELDEETKLYYFGARYYDPRTSVWQSADPILGKYLDGAAGGLDEPVNFALYTYARNNPLAYTDPDGNIVFLAAVPFVLKAMAVGAASSVAIGGGIRAATGEKILDGKAIAIDAGLGAAGGAFSAGAKVYQVSKMSSTAKGVLGRELTEQSMAKSGMVVEGTEVTVKAGGASPRLDFLAKTKDGALRGVESKFGFKAGDTAAQRAGYGAINGGEQGLLKGARAGEHAGKTIDKVDIMRWTPFDVVGKGTTAAGGAAAAGGYHGGKAAADYVSPAP